MSEKLEIWESQVAGRTSFTVREGINQRDMTVKGIGKRIRLTTDQREEIEEIISREHQNPFKNGTLLRVDSEKKGANSVNELSDDDLRAIFQAEDDSFIETLDMLGEVNVQRIAGMIQEVNATASQIAAIEDALAKFGPPRKTRGRPRKVASPSTPEEPKN